MTVQVRQLDLERKQDVRRFVEFPFALYADSPLWVPPLVSGTRTALDPRRHPFYRHSSAAFFLAERDGRVQGRIAALDNRNYNQHRGTSTGFFGYFESVDDVETARALFAAAFDWARRQGLNTMIGPKGLLGPDGGGVLVEGFDRSPCMSLPYNFPYYDTLIRDSGFDKETEFKSAFIRAGYQLPERYYGVAEKARLRRGFWIKRFARRSEMRQWIPRIVAAHRKAFSQAHTYYPHTDQEIAMIVEPIMIAVEPGLARLVMKGNEIVGFILIYRDLSNGLQRARGRLWPLGWVHVLSDRTRSRHANIDGLGILPEYRGLGANALLYTELDRIVKEYRFEEIELIQVEEQNVKSRAEMETIGAEWHKVHRSYYRAL